MKTTLYRDRKQDLAGALSRNGDGRESGVSETVGYILIFGMRTIILLLRFAREKEPLP